MAGGNPKGKPSSSSAANNRKSSRWEGGGNNPPSDRHNKPTTTIPAITTTATTSDTKTTIPKPSSTPKSEPSSKPGPSRPQPDPSGPGLLPPPNSAPPFPMPELGAPHGGPPPPFGADSSGFGGPPPPTYGFHMLERRTIFLADGSVRSYFALPPDYPDFGPQGRPPMDGRPMDGRPPMDGRHMDGRPPMDGRHMDGRPPMDGRHMDGRPMEERFLPPFGGPPPGSDRLGFDKQFPPSGRLSPESFRRAEREREEERFGRGAGPQNDYWNSLGLDGRQEGNLKRKFGDGDERDRAEELARQRQQLLQWGNSGADPNGFPSGSSGERAGFFGGGPSNPFEREMLERGGDDMRMPKHMRMGGDYHLGGGDFGGKDVDVDPEALKKAFLRYVRTINDDATLKRTYFEGGRVGPVPCLACSRSSKDFSDMHGLMVHAYESHSADLHVEHRGLHKAICVLMGWSHTIVPDNSKAYQSLSAGEAEANKDDLILWPPVVIIHNTNTGKNKEGRMEGLGSKAVDNKLKDLGFSAGKSKSLFGKNQEHRGITVVKFAGNPTGLKEAVRLVEHFERENHGRNGWMHAQSSRPGRDDDSNPNLVKIDGKTGDKKRIFYGYLATASDLEEVDSDTRKRATIESKKDIKA